MSDTLPAELAAQIDANLDEIPSATATEVPAQNVETPTPVEAKDDAAGQNPDLSTPSETTVSKDYQDWLNRYGGDPEKAARAALDASNELAKLKRPKAEPETTQNVETETVQTEAAKAPESVARYDQELQAIQEDYDKVREVHASVIGKKREVSGRIEEIVDLLSAPELDFDQQDALRKELRQKRAEQQRYDSQILNLKREAKELSRDFNATAQFKQQAETLSRLEQAREAEIKEREQRATQQENAAFERQLEAFGKSFFSEMEKALTDGEAIPAESVEDFKKQVKAAAHLELAGKELNPEDAKPFIAKFKTEFLATLDRYHRARSAQYGSRKAADAEVNAPNGVNAVATGTKRTGFRSQSEVDAFIDANA